MPDVKKWLKGEHKQLRAPIADIKRAWEKYLGKFLYKTTEQDECELKLSNSQHRLVKDGCIQPSCY